MNTIELELDGKKVEISKVGAIEGWKILRGLMAVLGTALERGSFGTGNAAETLFMKMPEQELIALLKRLTAYVRINGAPCNFELDMGVSSFSIDVITEVIKLNFEDFFSKMQTLWKGFLGENTPEEDLNRLSKAPEGL